MTIPLNNHHLSTFIKAWRLLSENPEEVVFSKNIYHDLQIADDIISDLMSSGNKLNGWKKQEIIKLNSTFQSSNIEVLLIKQYYLIQYNEIINVTSVNSSGNYSISSIPIIGKAIKNILTELNKPIHVNYILEFIKKICLSNHHNTENDIYILTNSLIDHLLRKHNHKYLEKYIISQVSRSYMSIYRSEINRILSDQDSHNQIMHILSIISKSLHIYIKVFKDGIKSDDIDEISKKLSRLLIFNDGDFSSRIRSFFIETIFDNMLIPEKELDLLKSLVDTNIDHDDSLNLLVESVFWNDLGANWLKEFDGNIISWFVRILAQLLSSSTNADFIEKNQYLSLYIDIIKEGVAIYEQYCSHQANRLAQLEIFSDWESELPREIFNGIPLTQYHSVEIRLKELINFNLYHIISYTSGDKLDIIATTEERVSSSKKLLVIIIRSIINTLQEDPKKLHDQNGIFQIQLLIHDINFQNKLLNFLNDYSSMLCKKFLTSSHLYTTDNRLLNVDINIWSKIITEQLTEYIIDGFDRNNYEYIQNKIKYKDIDYIFNELINNINNLDQEFTIIGIIDGLNLEGQNITIGDVTFYDSRIWSYGEGIQLDKHSPFAYRGIIEPYEDIYNSKIIEFLSQSQEYKGLYGNITNQLVKHSARFMTKIRASEEYIAREYGIIQARKMLDIFMWIFHDYPKGYGVQFGILPFILIISEDKENLKQINDKNISSITLLNAKEQELPKYIKSYQNILNIPDNKRNRIENAIIRAIHWYMQAYWNESNTDKYLKYWIALEQLFVEHESEKLTTIQNKLPQLIATWDRTKHGQLILKKWKEMIKEIDAYPEIKTAINSNIDLQNWNLNSLVILENISIIESIDNKNQLTSLPSLKILLDKKIIESQLNSIINEIKYSLSILNKMRNKIAHEGYNYSIDMPYYIQILERYLHRSIDRIIKCVINDVGKYQNIMDIVPTYNVPW